MREIKFRGKKVDSGKWVYGYYVKHETRQTCPMGNDKLSQDEIKHLIVVDSFADWNMPKTLQGIEVTPETVGQFTGLKDKNGVEIYEGDIVTACWYDYEEPNNDMTGIVEFTEGWMSYWIADYDKKEFSELNGQGYSHWTIEVIDNIYDNPELMEGEYEKVRRLR